MKRSSVRRWCSSPRLLWTTENKYINARGPTLQSTTQNPWEEQRSQLRPTRYIWNLQSHSNITLGSGSGSIFWSPVCISVGFVCRYGGKRSAVRLRYAQGEGQDYVSTRKIEQSFIFPDFPISRWYFPPSVGKRFTFPLTSCVCQWFTPWDFALVPLSCFAEISWANSR